MSFHSDTRARCRSPEKPVRPRKKRRLAIAGQADVEDMTAPFSAFSQISPIPQHTQQLRGRNFEFDMDSSDDELAHMLIPDLSVVIEEAPEISPLLGGSLV